jgi:hypothetical protein
LRGFGHPPSHDNFVSVGCLVVDQFRVAGESDFDSTKTADPVEVTLNVRDVGRVSGSE